MSEEEVRIREESLVLPYNTIKKNRTVKREFIIPLTKIEANEIEVLRKKVSKLESENEKIPQMQEQINRLILMVENLEAKTGFYNYNPGVFKKLVFNTEKNELYKIRGDFLARRKENSNYNNPMDVSIISH